MTSPYAPIVKIAYTVGEMNFPVTTVTEGMIGYVSMSKEMPLLDYVTLRPEPVVVPAASLQREICERGWYMVMVCMVRFEVPYGVSLVREHIRSVGLDANGVNAQPVDDMQDSADPHAILKLPDNEGLCG